MGSKLLMLVAQHQPPADQSAGYVLHRDVLSVCDDNVWLISGYDDHRHVHPQPIIFCH